MGELITDYYLLVKLECIKNLSNYLYVFKYELLKDTKLGELITD